MDLVSLAPLDRRRWVLAHAIDPALAELPPLPSQAAARQMLLSIAGVESGCLYRRQINGPARGLWQFERAGGVAGVRQHKASAKHAALILSAHGVTQTDMDAWNALEHDDVIAAAFARLLLLTDPAPLPNGSDSGREVYLRTWRPGKPASAAKWRECWDLAARAIAG